jgi:hypothetical protein
MTVSQIWIIGSNSSDDIEVLSSKNDREVVSDPKAKRSSVRKRSSRTKKKHSDDDNQSVSLSDFLDKVAIAPAISAIGASLLDLSYDDVQFGEDRMSGLQAEPTEGVVSEADVDAARSNLDKMERELGIS